MYHPSSYKKKGYLVFWFIFWEQNILLEQNILYSEKKYCAQIKICSSIKNGVSLINWLRNDVQNSATKSQISCFRIFRAKTLLLTFQKNPSLLLGAQSNPPVFLQENHLYHGLLMCSLKDIIHCVNHLWFGSNLSSAAMTVIVGMAKGKGGNKNTGYFYVCLFAFQGKCVGTSYWGL